MIGTRIFFGNAPTHVIRQPIKYLSFSNATFLYNCDSPHLRSSLIMERFERNQEIKIYRASYNFPINFPPLRYNPASSLAHQRAQRFIARFLSRKHLSFKALTYGDIGSYTLQQLRGQSSRAATRARCLDIHYSYSLQMTPGIYA